MFTVYTRDFGKLDILGKAIRKIKSKLRSGAEPFYLSEVEFIQGKGYKTLTDAILIEKFPDIRKDLKRLSIARQITGVLDTLVSKEEKDKQIWQLIKETFEKLDSLKKIETIYYYFFWNLVSVMGYQPEFQNCSINEKKVNCDIVKILRLILRKDWPILSRLRIEPPHQKLLKSVSQDYLNEILDKN